MADVPAAGGMRHDGVSAWPLRLLLGLAAGILFLSWAAPAEAQGPPTVQYVAVGIGGRIAYSFDGLAYSPATYAPSGNPIWAVGFNGTHWVAAASGIAWVSADGITWANYATGMGATTWGGVTWGAGRWIIAGGGGQVATSTNGAAWSPVTYPGGVGNILGTTYNGTRFITTGNFGGAYSDNGLSWTLLGSLGLGGTPNARAQAYFNETWWAGSQTPGGTSRSTNGGVSWTVGAFVPAVTKFACDEAGNMVAISNAAPRVFTTTDAVAWTPRPNPFTGSMYGLANGNGYFVAGTTSGQVGRSADGASWTLGTWPWPGSAVYAVESRRNSRGDCPTFKAVPDFFAFNEDQPEQSFNVTANDRSRPGVGFSLISHTWPSKGMLSGPLGGGVFAYRPFADANGIDSFTYTIQDAEGRLSTGTVTLLVQAVNDAPSFAGSTVPIVASPTEGPHEEPGWATLVRPGPASATDEAAQPILFELVSNSNPALFAAPPTLRRTGAADSTAPADPPVAGGFAVLRFEPGSASGQSTLCFRARDGGGTATVATVNLVPPRQDVGIDASTPQCAVVVLNGPPTAYFEVQGPAAPGEALAFDSCPGLAPDRCTHDLDGTVAGYLWDFGDGTLGHAPSPLHAFGAPGRYVVRLTVTDDSGQRGSMVRTVVVAWPGAAPLGEESFGSPGILLADAGGNRTAEAGGRVLLHGRERGGDPDVSFQWVQVAGPAVALGGQDAPTLSFDAPIPGDGRPVQLLFALRVAKGGLASPADHAAVTVLPPAGPPVAHAGGTRTVAAGAAVALDGSRSQAPEGAGFAWEQVDGPPVALAGDGPVATFTAPGEASVLRFRLRVGAEGRSSQDVAVVYVLAPEAPPAGVALAYTVVPTAAGAEVRFVAVGAADASWDFGDGQRGQGASVSHAYAPGGYDVAMTAGGATRTEHIDVRSRSPAGHAQEPGPALGWAGLGLLAAGALVALLAVRHVRRGA